MADEKYAVKLDIFEGPMDLLLYLVLKNDLDIYNIPVSFITDEYLNVIKLMNYFNIDYAAEFLYMASTLAHIKSRMLLPVSETNEDEIEDPALDIIRPLQDYLIMKLSAEKLKQNDILGQDVFTRSLNDAFNFDCKSEIQKINLFELIETYRTLTEALYDNHTVVFRQDSLSVKDRIGQLIDSLNKQPNTGFHSLLEGNGTTEIKVLTFLALLEMAKLNLIKLNQHIQSGIIRVSFL